MEVISNDGQVAYTEDGEEWRYDRQWYAQNETKKIADLIHHELVKESETIESTSEVIESVPSTSNNKADMWRIHLQVQVLCFPKKQVYLLK